MINNVLISGRVPSSPVSHENERFVISAKGVSFLIFYLRYEAFEHGHTIQICCPSRNRGTLSVREIFNVEHVLGIVLINTIYNLIRIEFET